MFRWLQSLFGQGAPDSREGLIGLLRAMNSAAGGGTPRIEQHELGVLSLPSGILALADPQYVGGPLEVSGFASNRTTISVEAWRYPSGLATVRRLTLRFDCGGEPDGVRELGDMPIDSAKLISADKSDLARYWTDVGPDRIGVISTAPDETVMKLLEKRFGLQTRRVNIVRAEVMHPVSTELEREIESYLKSIPEYAAFPFMEFHVQTNNSFDRVNALDAPWDFIPIGNATEPLMFACTTGDGDGSYPVRGHLVGERLQSVTVTFIGDEELAND